ncbi:DUF4307 domain-containing protein [Nocardia asteroides]|uniref:DUF4307 domain-containing protein n=1 Tax=Nocardia asteroides TaxID=1824 RepID=UPI001E35CADA|nr:DUF4307 domain-containing protein [Nocardia asteroides]UGT64319.1 DUF4307 domain-containing protein [Nocardia asteroides]
MTDSSSRAGAEPDPATQAEIAEAQRRRATRRAERYGGSGRTGPGRGRAVAAGLGVLVVAAGVGVGFLGYQKFGPKDVEAEQLGYVVVDDSTLDLRIKVTRADPAQPVVCIVRVMSRDGEETGRREVLVTPSVHGTVEVATVIRSSERPASGSVYACSTTVPGYLRAD